MGRGRYNKTDKCKNDATVVLGGGSRGGTAHAASDRVKGHSARREGIGSQELNTKETPKGGGYTHILVVNHVEYMLSLRHKAGKKVCGWGLQCKTVLHLGEQYLVLTAIGARHKQVSTISGQVHAPSGLSTSWSGLKQRQRQALGVQPVHDYLHGKRNISVPLASFTAAQHGVPTGGQGAHVAILSWRGFLHSCLSSEGAGRPEVGTRCQT